jgi:hypothetical protein
MSQKYSIYFAGDLFNHKDLIGNLLLSEALEKNSAGRFVCQGTRHTSRYFALGFPLSGRSGAW